MRRPQLQALSREELIVEAERAGVPRPRVLTQAELVDEILKRTAGSDREKTKARGWLGRARDLIATVVEKGLHLPDAAAAIRTGQKGWPPPPPPLPTVTLAEIYAAQGHLERAVAVLDDVLRREPDHQEARELRERFLAQLARGPKSVPEPPVSSAADTEPSPAQAPVVEAKVEKASDEEAAPAASSEGPAAASSDAPAAASSAAEPSISAEVENTTDEAAPPRERVTLPSAPPPAEAKDLHAAAVASESEEMKLAAADDAATTASGEAAAIDESTSGKEVASDESASGEEAAAAAKESGDEAAAKDEAESDEEVAAKEAAATEGAEEAAEAAEAEPEPVLPERYDVDEVVALAVDPSTFYVYWEVRPTTFAHMAARSPSGSLALRVTAVTPGWDGPIVETRDVAIDALHGDHFIHHVRPRADVRVSVGWISEGRFDPIAIGAEVSAPRAFVAAGSPAPAGAPLDLSEGPHGTPAGFVRPVTFADHPRGAALLASGWVPRDLGGTAMEGASEQSPEGTGDGPTGWIWVPGPISEQIGMSVMIGPSTAELPRAALMDSSQSSQNTADSRSWGGASDSGSWGGASESGPWGGASESGPWGGASESLHR